MKEKKMIRKDIIEGGYERREIVREVEVVED